MNSTVINILQSSPNYFFEQQISFDESITLKFMILSFDLILLSTLNHAKLPQISLFTLYLESFFTEVKLKVSNQFDFHRMKYDSYIDLVCPQEYVEKRSVQVDNYNHQENKVHKIKIRYDFKEHQNLKTIKETKIRFNIGNFDDNQQKSKHIGKFSIQNLTCNLESNKNLRKNEQTQIALFNSQVSSSICNHEDQSGSFPVLYMIEYNNLKSQGQEYFSQLIQNLDPYNASDTSSKPNHLFICHDMKDGYYEDTRFTDPVENIRKNSYRFNFFWHTSVFNYFSHKTITIPPRHWRQVCKRYQVKCLGTFIVQNGRVDENFFMTNQFALKLIYLAKKYKFDGYLINIENEIKDIEALKRWLGFLTNKIHTQIPGSMISWYDSVTTSGAVQYQNQVNEKNKIFYDLTDSFYTNYWWTDDMLKKDLNEAQPNKTIYIGNDVWGRGTYGGGQFYIYKAIDQIQKMNRPNQPNLVPALFAPGYTYQSGGENNNPFLKANEDRLYRGVIFETPELKEWKSFEQNEKNLLDLKNQKEWDGKYHSINLWQYSNKGKLKITFIYRVNNTFPQNIKTSNYKILMRLQDTLLNQTILQAKIQKENITLIHKQIKKLQLMIDTKKITPKTDLEIYAATSMKDIFEDQKILISFYLPNIDWIQQVPITKLHFNSPYNSFLNIGYGQNFYFKGKPILRNYNFLADYDMPPTLSLNHPFSSDIQHDDSYIGGSSIVLHQSPVKLFLIDLPSYQHSYPQSYFAKIVKKGGDIVSFYFLQSSGFSVFLTKIQQKKLDNGWTEQTYQISAASMKKMKKKFFKDLQTSLLIEVKQKCLIGQIYLQPKFTETSQVKQRQMLELSISQSFRTEAKDQIFLDIDLTEISLKQSSYTKKTHRYLVIIDQQFSAFIYLDKSASSFKGKLRQIKLKISDNKSQIKIYDVDDGMHEKVLLQQKDINFSELKSFPISHKINIKNY